MRRTPRLASAALALSLAACGRDSTTAREPFTPSQYSMEDFYGNKEFFGGSFSADRRNILVGSNLSGIYNAYAIPVAGGEPIPLTSSTGESIFAISYFPADDRILYASDGQCLITCLIDSFSILSRATAKSGEDNLWGATPSAVGPPFEVSGPECPST